MLEMKEETVMTGGKQAENRRSKDHRTSLEKVFGTETDNLAPRAGFEPTT